MKPFNSLIISLRIWGLWAALLSLMGCAARDRVHFTLAKSEPPAYLPAISEAKSEPDNLSRPAVKMVGFHSAISTASELEFGSDGPQQAQRAGTAPTERVNESVDATAGDQPINGQEDGNASASSVQRGPAINGEGTGAPTAGYSVADYVAMACATHPKIAAANHRLAAAQNRIAQARSLADPMLSETFWPFNGNALETAGGRAANQLAISQAVPWPEKLAAREAIAGREAQVIEAEVQRIRLEITESVQLACFEIWFTTRSLAVIDESGQLVKELIEVSEARYRSGGSQQDILRAQLESDRLAERLVQLMQQKRVAQADLATLLQTPRDAEYEITFDSTNLPNLQELDALIAQAESTNPDLRGLQAQIARDREKQRLAGLQKYPDFQVGMNWMIISDQNAISPVANGNDNFGFTVGMSLPVYREKIDAGIRESAHSTSSTANLLQSERDSVAGKLRRLLAQVDSLAEQERIYTERIMPRTEDTLKISLADYRGKKADFLSVIETYRELLQLEIQLVRLQATRAGVLAQIARVLGSPAANILR